MRNNFFAWLACGVLLDIGLTSPLPAQKGLTRISKSTGITEVLDLDSSRRILGRREISMAAGQLTLVSFVTVDGREAGFPIPLGFTNIEALRLSENGYVVGYASRPMGHPDGNLRATVWNVHEPQEKPHVLGPPAGFRGSCAFDISANGQVVSGYVLGRDPPRLLPSIWRRVESAWHCELLSAPRPYNPLLVGGRVVISDDGQTVAASLDMRPLGDTSDATYRNHLNLWRAQADGSWKRQVALRKAVNLNDVNNHGLAVGRIVIAGRRRAMIFDGTKQQEFIPDLWPGDEASEATAVNNLGQVVGYSDDPPGPDGVSEAFLWEQGQMSRLPLPVDCVHSVANSITDDRQVGGSLIIGSDDPEKTAPMVEGFVLGL